MSDSMTGKKMDYRSELQISDKDHYTYSMSSKGMDTNGAEFKTMEIAYTRK